jgi:coenzyme F420 hydrogenase subunit beta
MNSIKDVIVNGLCNGCGTCAGICPQYAITIIEKEGLYFPFINEEKCIDCKLCIKSCPGYSVDFVFLNSKIFRQQPNNNFIGKFNKCYIAQSNNKNIQFNSTSGGIVTELLLFALEEKIIDGAMIVGMNENNPLRPKPFIAKSKEEIISGSKSKYCPVPINIVLKKIINEDGNFAVVGLPCHIHGIRKAINNLPNLRKKIVLTIGLLCSHTVNFYGTELILEKFGIKKNQIKKIDYRGEGWPGSMSIELRNGKTIKIPLFGSWIAYWPIFSSFFFTPLRCAMCPDQANELADISLGDAWLPEFRKEKMGKSILLTRTQVADKILMMMKKAGKISIMTINHSRFIQSQKLPLKFKKTDINFRISLFHSFGINSPNIKLGTREKKSFLTVMRSFFVYFNIKLSSIKLVRKIMVHVPFPLFRLYNVFYKYL